MADRHPQRPRKFVREKWCPECQIKMKAHVLYSEAGGIETSYHCPECDYEMPCGVFDEVDEDEFYTHE